MGINYKTDTTKGYYQILNKDKYYPSGKVPIYKSSWEMQVFYALDINPNVLYWGYEPLEIYYYNPRYLKYSVYYPDILCHIRMDSGVEQKILIEIKPTKYTVMPKKPNPPKENTPAKWERFRRSQINYENNLKDYMVNLAKWEAAQRWCQKNGVMWRILNENNTNNMFK